jgi:hypothetical protein
MRSQKDELSKTANLDEAKNVAGVLEKYASSPYNPHTFEAISGIMKVASATVTELVEALAAEMGKCSSLKKSAEINSIIGEMIDSGMISRGEIQEKTASLLKKTDHELAVTREAMGMVKKANLSQLFSSDQGSTSINGSDKKPGMFDKALYNN